MTTGRINQVTTRERTTSDTAAVAATPESESNPGHHLAAHTLVSSTSDEDRAVL